MTSSHNAHTKRKPLRFPLLKSFPFKLHQEEFCAATSVECIRKIIIITMCMKLGHEHHSEALCVFDDTNERFSARERHVSLSVQAIENKMRQSFLHHLPHLNAVCRFQLYPIVSFTSFSFRLEYRSD